MTPGESIADLVDKMERLEREMLDAGITLDPLIAPIRVLTAVSKVDRYKAIANVVLGSDAPITMKAVHQAMRAIEVTDGVTKPTGQAFLAEPAVVHSAAHAPVQAPMTGTQPAQQPDATSTALAALAKAVNRMQDRMDRTEAQHKRDQQQQSHRGAVPEKVSQQSVQRKQPYPQHTDGQGAREHTCYNCGRTGHGFAKCRTPCTVCGGPAPAKGGHSAHRCPSRGGGAANVAFTGTVATGMTGTAFLGLATSPHHGPAPPGHLPQDMPSPFLADTHMPSPFLALPFGEQQFPDELGHPGGYRGPHMNHGPPGARAPGRGNGFGPCTSKSQMVPGE